MNLQLMSETELSLLEHSEAGDDAAVEAILQDEAVNVDTMDMVRL